MKENGKRIIAGIIGGGLTFLGIVATNQEDCPWILKYEGIENGATTTKELCLDNEQMEFISSGLREASGFGGTQFGQ